METMEIFKAAENIHKTILKDNPGITKGETFLAVCVLKQTLEALMTSEMIEYQTGRLN